MRRKRLAVQVVTLGIVLAVVSHAGDRRGDDDRDGATAAFVGLWEAIDSFDGSTQRLSVTCASRRRCEVRLNDSFFSDCNGGIGFARGTGSIRDGVLASELTLSCGNLTLSQFNEFVPDERNGTLTNLNDSPGLPNLFHRVSR